MFRFRPSVESLETRETPGGITISSATDLVIESDSPSGPGVYRTMNGGSTWTLAPGTSADAKPLPVLMVIANRDFY